jgi:hypothetical protein
MFTGALVVMVLGVGMGLGGWLSFRRPGVTMLPVPSIWRTPRFLTWPGAVLWLSGCCVYVVGVFCFLSLCLRDLSGPAQP